MSQQKRTFEHWTCTTTSALEDWMKYEHNAAVDEIATLTKEIVQLKAKLLAQWTEMHHALCEALPSDD